MADDPWDDTELDGLLGSLDHEVPTITAEDVITRARRSRLGPARIALGVALAIGLAGVAYALPGSPVRSWVDSVLDRIGENGGIGSVDHPPPRSSGERGAGIVFDPAEPLSVETASGSSGYLRIAITEEEQLVAQMVSGQARFTSDPEGLRVDLLAPDTFELRVPRSASSVVVTAGGRRVFIKQGADISTSMEADSEGRYGMRVSDGPP